MKILSIDPAEKSGWSFRDTEKPSRNKSGMEQIKAAKGESYDFRLKRYERWVLDLLLKYKPDYLLYERPTQGHFQATRSHSNLESCILLACNKYKDEYEFKLDHGNFAPMTIKAHAKKYSSIECKGSFNKKQMIASAKEFFGIDIIDDNHADALWLGQYFIDEML